MLSKIGFYKTILKEFLFFVKKCLLKLDFCLDILLCLTKI